MTIVIAILCRFVYIFDDDDEEEVGTKRAKRVLNWAPLAAGKIGKTVAGDE